jgi:hypothetical protein
LIWNDSEYGLITWHQLRRFGRPSHVDFKSGFRQIAWSAPGVDPYAWAGAGGQYGGHHRLPSGLFREHEANKKTEGAFIADLNGFDAKTPTVLLRALQKAILSRLRPTAAIQNRGWTSYPVAKRVDGCAYLTQIF